MEWHIIPTGRVWVDPGGALGLVPMPLWSKHQPTDEHHRVPMDLNSMLIFSEGKTILIDTGLGHKLPERVADNWGYEWPEGTLLDNLATHGISPEDIDIVLDTHLHSDHCGGSTRLVDGQLQPTFPHAEYWVQRLEFADAMHPDARTRGTYLAENFVPVWQSGQLKMLHGDTQVTAEIRCVVTRGHTRGHQSILVEGGEQPILFLSDLASFAVHIAHAAWVTAYDVEPLETIATKQRWQTWALENDALLVFQHDAHIRTGELAKNEKKRLAVKLVEPGSIPL